MVVRGNRIFGFGWIFHPQHAVTHLWLKITLADGSQRTLQVELGRARVDVAQAFPGLANAVRAGYFVFGGWSGAALDSVALAGRTGDGAGFELAVPVTALDSPAPEPSLLARYRPLLKRAGGLARSGRLRLLFAKAREHFGQNAAVLNYSQAGVVRELRKSACGRATLMLDHDLGGGANIYRERIITECLARGEAVALLTYQVRDLRYVLETRTRKRTRRFAVDGPAVIEALACAGCFAEIMFNNAVSFERPEEIPLLLAALKRRHGIPLTVVLHDYYSLCPSQFLLDHQARFCGVPDPGGCNACLAANKDGFVSLFPARDMATWRANWGALLDAADHLILFSESSRALLMRAYPSLSPARIHVRPHAVARPSSTKPRLRAGTPMHLGVVGHINHAKGANVVRELSREIASRGLDIRITVIGSITGDCAEGVVTETGVYAHADLPALIERSGANLFLFPSIVPETFSFVTQELIDFGVPLVCFDLGAQAERVRHYDKGRVIQWRGAAQALAQMRDFHAARSLDADTR